ncbi:helix-turn-helix domain-containing protein [Streptomyces drozdowiczii]|uniref:helix-turn-helix domain-containing protein n=1 Tax=Streptomyces drozdowiczii TaxID=202862 RepID=UPI00403C7DF0
MTTLSFHRYVLQCEGCPARFGDPHGYNSPDLARVASRQSGWGTPPVRRAGGGLGVITSDVCPNCLSGWEPVLFTRRQHGRRLSADEAPDSWPLPVAPGRPAEPRLAKPKPKRPTAGELLSPADVCELYGFSPQTLANYRWQGVGPDYIKTSAGRSGRVKYRRSAVEEWLKSQTVQIQNPPG